MGTTNEAGFSYFYWTVSRQQKKLMGSSCAKESIHVDSAGRLLALTLCLLRSVLLSQLLFFEQILLEKKVELVQTNLLVYFC